MAENEPVIIETTEIVVTEQQWPYHASRELLERRPRKVYGGMWGPLEIGSLAVAALALIGVTALYMIFVLPSNRELAGNSTEAERLEAEKVAAKAKYGEITDTKSHVEKLLTSVDDFETRFLPPATNGRATLYQRINGLIQSYGLTNTSGPDYQPLETADQDTGGETDEERGRAKYRSLFPGIYVTMTVEGPYQSLRRFIRDVETGNEFVVISTIELEPSDAGAEKKAATGAPPVGGGGQQIDPMTGAPIPNQPAPGAARNKGKTHGEVVALHLEMAAYFRRANYAPMTGPIQ